MIVQYKKDKSSIRLAVSGEKIGGDSMSSLFWDLIAKLHRIIYIYFGTEMSHFFFVPILRIWLGREFTIFITNGGATSIVYYI